MASETCQTCPGASGTWILTRRVVVSFLFFCSISPVHVMSVCVRVFLRFGVV